MCLLDEGTISEMATVLRLAESGHEDLIAHPVVSSLAWLKWKRVNKWIYVSMVVELLHHIMCTVTAVMQRQDLSRSVGNQTHTDTNENSSDIAKEVVVVPVWLFSWLWLTSLTIGKVTTGQYIFTYDVWKKFLNVALFSVDVSELQDSHGQKSVGQNPCHPSGPTCGCDAPSGRFWQKRWDSARDELSFMSLKGCLRTILSS